MWTASEEKEFRAAVVRVEQQKEARNRAINRLADALMAAGAKLSREQVIALMTNGAAVRRLLKPYDITVAEKDEQPRAQQTARDEVFAVERE